MTLTTDITAYPSAKRQRDFLSLFFQNALSKLKKHQKNVMQPSVDTLQSADWWYETVKKATISTSDTTFRRKTP